MSYSLVKSLTAAAVICACSAIPAVTVTGNAHAENYPASCRTLSPADLENIFETTTPPSLMYQALNSCAWSTSKGVINITARQNYGMWDPAKPQAPTAANGVCNSAIELTGQIVSITTPTCELNKTIANNLHRRFH